MARIKVAGDRLVVRLAWWEKAAIRRGNVRLPAAAVEWAAVEPDWWRALRGTPDGGLMVPGTLCLGVRRHCAGRDFTAIRPRHGAVVCVELNALSPFTRVAVSTPQAERTVAAIRTAVHRAAAVTPGDAARTAHPP